MILEIYPTLNTASTEESSNQPDFSFMQTMLLFIGYPRSGSTLLGSLLDAHPAMVVANEYNLVFKLKNFASNKKTREDVFAELYRNSVLEASKEQRAANKKYFFHYHVPGLWQGKTKGPLKVCFVKFLSLVQLMILVENTSKVCHIDQKNMYISTPQISRNQKFKIKTPWLKLKFLKLL